MISRRAIVRRRTGRYPRLGATQLTSPPRGTGALTGQPGKVTVQNPQTDLLPGGARIRGINCAVTVQSQDSPNGAGATPTNVLSEMWTTWDWADLEAKLDLAALAGLNTVILANSITATATGAITRTKRNQQWKQFSDACQARGLFMYITLADGGNDRFDSRTFAEVQAEVVDTATYLNTLPDIVGMDIVSEKESFSGTANAKTLYDAVKAVTQIPLTYSYTAEPTAARMSDSYRQDRVDFIDAHIYGGDPSPKAALLQTQWNSNALNKPFLVGEFGTFESADNQDTQALFFRRIGNMARATGNAGERIAGSILFTIRDFHRLPAPQVGWYPDGLYTADVPAVPRTYLTDIFPATYPAGITGP